MTVTPNSSPPTMLDSALDASNVSGILELLSLLDERPELRATARQLFESAHRPDGTPVLGSIVALAMHNALDEADVHGEDSADLFLRRLQKIRDALAGRTPDEEGL